MEKIEEKIDEMIKEKIEFCQKWEEVIQNIKHFNITFGNERFYLKGAFTKEREEQRKNWFREELIEYITAKQKNDKIEILDAICDMYYIHIGSLLEKYEGDVIKVLKEIMSVEFDIGEKDDNLFLIKIFVEEFCIVNDVLFSAMGEVHRSNMSKLDDNGRPIYREDGKIIKSKNFFAPNLKQFVKEVYWCERCF